MKTIGNFRIKRNCAHFAFLAFAAITFVAMQPATADEQPMLYFFTSKGCAPCIQVKHVVKQLDSEGFPVKTVDVGERPDWADAFRVSHTPTLVLVKNNEVLAWQPRPMRAEELRGWFRTIGYSATTKRTSLNDSVSSTQARVQPVQQKVSVPAKKASALVGSFSTPTMLNGTRRPRTVEEANALGATIRLQVKDSGGTSYATGTVVHSHEGESLVVTCGHVFRESKGRGEIVAELIYENQTVKVPGQLLDYDSNANDIALVSISNGRHRLSVAEIAPSRMPVERGDRIFTLGCDHGEDPTIRRSAIKNLARYDGSMKYDIYGRPVNGRSGGGMFNSSGQLIGVCNAAAVEVDEGIYSALETIHWQLAKANLDRLFEATPSRIPEDPGPTAIASARAATVSPSRDMVPIRRRARDRAPNRIAMASSDTSRIRNVSLQEAIPSGDDREVLITIRSKSNPSNSRTITISDPTPKLLDYLDSMDGAQSRSLKMAQYRTTR